MFLFKRSNGIYHIIYNKSDGKRTTLSTKTKLKSEALKFLTKYSNQCKINKETESIPIDLKTFSKEYLKYSELNHTWKTTLTYKTTFNDLIKYFPNIKIQELNQRNIEDYIQSKIRNVSLHCARKHLINIKAMLNRAVTLGFINNNPANNIKRIKPPEKLPIFFNKEEFEKLITVIDNQDLKDIVLFAVNTGLRQMEILSLRKNQFYESEKLIVLDNQSHITKSKKIRAIPLNNISFEIIQRRVNANDNENIFTLDSETIKQDFLIHKFKKYIISAGLNPKLNFHSLRHTFASWLIQKNISIYSVSKLLGHSDVKTTQIYSHLTQDKLMESVKSLELF